jgi:sec-independent protein translocase protein TatA
MLGNLTGWHFLIIALVILLIFGATRLPALARSVGQSMKIFKNEMKTDESAASTDEGAGTAESKATTPASDESAKK